MATSAAHPPRAPTRAPVMEISFLAITPPRISGIRGQGSVEKLLLIPGLGVAQPAPDPDHRPGQARSQPGSQDHAQKEVQRLDLHLEAVFGFRFSVKDIPV